MQSRAQNASLDVKIHNLNSCLNTCYLLKLCTTSSCSCWPGIMPKMQIKRAVNHREIALSRISNRKPGSQSIYDKFIVLTRLCGLEKAENGFFRFEWVTSTSSMAKLGRWFAFGSCRLLKHAQLEVLSEMIFIELPFISFLCERSRQKTGFHWYPLMLKCARRRGQRYLHTFSIASAAHRQQWIISGELCMHHARHCYASCRIFTI